MSDPEKKLNENESQQGEIVVEPKDLSPEVLAELRRRFPEQIFGTREWVLKVRIDVIKDIA